MIAKAVSFIKAILFPPNPRRCTICGGWHTKMNGTRPITDRDLGGAKSARHQNYWCHDCQSSYYVPDPKREKGKWYARQVYRKGLDMYFHIGGSWRKVTEWIRSEINVGSERSVIWNPLRWALWRKKSKRKAPFVRLSHTTLWRIAQLAGGRARAMRGKYGEAKNSGILGCDETGILIRGISAGLQVLVDGASRLVWRLRRLSSTTADQASLQLALESLADEVGLKLEDIKVWLSDGASAYDGVIGMVLWWVVKKRCVFHLLRNAWSILEGYRAKLVRQGQAELGLSREQAEALAEVAVRAVMRTLRRIWLAPNERGSFLGIAEWHRRWAGVADLARLGRLIEQTFHEATLHLKGTVPELSRTSNVCEWIFRRYKWRYEQLVEFMSPSGSDNFNALWEMHYNFQRYQIRREVRRSYPYGGKCPLELSEVDIGMVSWLDALRI